MLAQTQISLTHHFTDKSIWETAEHFTIGFRESADEDFIGVGFTDMIHGYEHAIHLAQILGRRYEVSVQKPSSGNQQAILTVTGKKLGGSLSNVDIMQVLRQMEMIGAIAPLSRSIASEQLVLQPI